MSITQLLDTPGFIWAHRLSEDDILELGQLKSMGEVQSLSQLGINFMNNEYCYVRVGNPDKVGVVVEGNISFLRKGADNLS